MFAWAYGDTWTFAWESEGWGRVLVCHCCQKGYECQRCGLSDNSEQKWIVERCFWCVLTVSSNIVLKALPQGFRNMFSPPLLVTLQCSRHHETSNEVPPLPMPTRETLRETLSSSTIASSSQKLQQINTYYHPSNFCYSLWTNWACLLLYQILIVELGFSGF